MALALRPFTATDLPFALEQARREGWTSSRAWFEVPITHDPGLCFVADDHGTLVGMITASRFASSAWVGNLIVAPERRRSGLGTRLMEHVLRLLHDAGVRTVRLEADPPGMNIYRRLGFVEELMSLRFLLPSPHIERAARTMPITADTLHDVVAFDRPRFGDDRSRLLGALFQHTATAIQLHGAAGLTGYAFLVEINAGMSSGPWVADDPGAAAELLATCRAAAGGREVRVGIPAPNRAGCDLLRTLGGRETAPSVRMVLGERASAGDPTTIYGIINGAVG